MKRLINEEEKIVDDMISGYIKICRGAVKKVPGVNAVIKTHAKDKVSVIVGGGSGLDPWPIGYVGDGLADGAAVGNIFTAPPARSILEATRCLPHEKGVIYVVTNHAGDVLNFELVSELAGLEGIKTRQIYIADDIASASRSEREERRGIGGVAILTKIAGAVTEAGNTLDETERILRKANENIGTFSVTTAPSCSPVTGKECFTLDEGQMEFGMGFNGETGISREMITGANGIAEKLMKELLNDLGVKAQDKVAVWINGYSLTSQIELSIIAGTCCDILEERKIELHDIVVERLYVTPGAGGLSISIIKLDEEMTRYYNRRAEAPFFKIGERGEADESRRM